MAKDNYIQLIIDGKVVDIDPEGQVPTIDYALEDEQNFEQKKSAEAFDIILPDTTGNLRIGSAAPDQVGRWDKPLPMQYLSGGHELFVGKFFYQGTQEQAGRPVKHRGKAYGLNGDWVIDLKEATLMDFMNPRAHAFDQATAMASWNFDGRSEAQDYVYAPVRYRKPFGDYPPVSNDPNAPTRPDDANVILNDLKPSVSVYWILWRGFRSAGYRLRSQFMDTDYYRRGVLPWTWGGFDFLDDTRWEGLKFLAKQESRWRKTGDYTGYPDLNVRTSLPGGYDNSSTYSYTPASSPLSSMMVWTYPTGSAMGKVRARVSLQVAYKYKLTDNCEAEVRVQWYKGGLQGKQETIVSDKAAGINLQAKQGYDMKESFYEADMNPGEYIGARIWVRTKDSTFGSAEVEVTVEQFTLDFLKLTTGSPIQLNTYPKLKNYKWMDLLRGEIDLFDLAIQTDPVRKEVYIEPRHGYTVGGQAMPGYFNRQSLDWSGKRDISKLDDLELYSDSEREFVIHFKEDGQDGGLKKVQDRNQVTIGQGGYLFPERFKTGKKDLPNRFYSALMHYDHETFRYITGVAPQLSAIIPENVSNTSSEASENTFQPKRAYYKGNVTGAGGWKFMGAAYSTLPFLFAVNYKAGGEMDPVLSYQDQRIGEKVARGLLSTFYLGRLAIMRHGRRYSAIHFRLKSVDVANFLHRESIILAGTEYLLTHIKGYSPVDEESTQCVLWAYAPVTTADRDAVRPSRSLLLDGTAAEIDQKGWPHLLLPSDVPK